MAAEKAAKPAQPTAPAFTPATPHNHTNTLILLVHLPAYENRTSQAYHATYYAARSNSSWCPTLTTIL